MATKFYKISYLLIRQNKTIESSLLIDLKKSFNQTGQQDSSEFFVNCFTMKDQINKFNNVKLIYTEKTENYTEKQCN